MDFYKSKWFVIERLDQGSHIAEDMNAFNTRREAMEYAKEVKEYWDKELKWEWEHGEPSRWFEVKVVKNDGTMGY